MCLQFYTARAGSNVFAPVSPHQDQPGTRSSAVGAGLVASRLDGSPVRDKNVGALIIMDCAECAKLRVLRLAPALRSYGARPMQYAVHHTDTPVVRCEPSRGVGTCSRGLAFDSVCINKT
jgi:hypothetical protein